MNQADVSKLVSQLRVVVRPRARRLRNPDGPEGRLNILRNIVTGLIKYERIELGYQKADEARGYAERLISEAIRHGDCHEPTMEIADYWILEKQYVHKLFKVLVPRLQNCTTSYTRLFKAPITYPDYYMPRAVLELKGNPFPPLRKDLSHNRNLLHNALLDAARKDYREEQYMKIAQGISSQKAAGGNVEPTTHTSENLPGQEPPKPTQELDNSNAQEPAKPDSPGKT